MKKNLKEIMKENLKEIKKDREESVKKASQKISELMKKWVEQDRLSFDPELKLSSVLHDSEVDHPSHYTQGGIEVIDILEAKLTPEEFFGYLKGSLLAYLFRAPHKGQETKDYKKSQWYLNRIIKHKEKVCQKTK